MARLDGTLDRIRFARRYTLWHLDSVPEADWFRMPTEGVTHIAYQAGHIAHAQYRLCLARARGERLSDAVIIPPTYRELFGRNPPSPDPAVYPTPAEIRGTMDRVYAQVLLELPTFASLDLDDVIPPEHKYCKTRGEFLDWCPAHEMIHTGQIALLRRLLGHKPLW
jgi:hypothetical protein